MPRYDLWGKTRDLPALRRERLSRLTKDLAGQSGKEEIITWGPRSAHRESLLSPASVRPADLACDDGHVAGEFVWAALDCPTGGACVGAHHLGVSGDEHILLGRMAAQIDQYPMPGEQCVLVAWATGRDGRKLFANSALLGPGGAVLAIAKATWLIVDPQAVLRQG